MRKIFGGTDLKQSIGAELNTIELRMPADHRSEDMK